MVGGPRGRAGLAAALVAARRWPETGQSVAPGSGGVGCRRRRRVGGDDDGRRPAASIGGSLVAGGALLAVVLPGTERLALGRPGCRGPGAALDDLVVAGRGHRLAGRWARPRRRGRTDRAPCSFRGLRRHRLGARHGGARARAPRRRQPLDGPRPRGRGAGRRRRRRFAVRDDSGHASVAAAARHSALGSPRQRRVDARLRRVDMDRCRRGRGGPRPDVVPAHVVPVGGSALLGVAYVLRLAASDVDVVEAYTLPFAAFLLAAGLWAMRKQDGLGSVRALLPGMALAMLPSLPRRSTSRPACGRSSSAPAQRSPSASGSGDAGRCRSPPARSSWGS